MTCVRRVVAALTLFGGVFAAGAGLFPEFAQLSAVRAAELPKAAASSGVDVAAAQQPMSEAEYSERGTAQCLECHDTVAILNTPHAQMGDSRTPFATQGCETCHGPNRAHTEDPSVDTVAVRFGPGKGTPAAEQNKICLGCHEGGLRMNWVASQHYSGDVTCATCHNVHAMKDKVLVKATQPEVCFTCHFDQRAQSRKLSRHPIKEGKVVCSDCHNPHGSFGPSQLVKNTVNETCYQCHAEKRGPFLWEHAPVTDSCTNCHNPHGSSHKRMLTARMPWLCQTCHEEGFHPSTLYSGTGLPTANPGSRLLAKSCLNCHPKVHGTNHPSGPRLTR
jgi:DmsE family decaheme c-type cytochrome